MSGLPLTSFVTRALENNSQVQEFYYEWWSAHVQVSIKTKW